MRRNPEKAREAMRRWRARHPAEHNAERRGYYARNRAKLLARSASYHRAHPGVRKASDNKRRVQKAASASAFTPAEWLALVTTFAGHCAYCGMEGPLEADHRIPLARGGTNDIVNILPACRRCNARKHLMTEQEFRARLASEGGPQPTIDP
jgi:5-methylcytosine-specific restriction endonuclease McrA